jgi:hypothetical protein
MRTGRMTGETGRPGEAGKGGEDTKYVLGCIHPRRE